MDLLVQIKMTISIQLVIHLISLTVCINDLNKVNTEEVFYFLFKNNKYDWVNSRR